MRQLALSLSPPPSPTLDNFLVGGNAELLFALRALVSGDSPERFIYIWGGAGCGKTHLLRATRAALAQRGIAAAVLVLPGTFAEPPPVPVVLVDDVDRLNEVAQEQLFTIYNTQREGGRALVAAGTLPPTSLPLRQDVVTRLGWGLVYQIRMLSDEEKMAAMVAHARARGFNLPVEVIEYVLKRRARDLPGLLALLDALDRYSLESKRAVTIPLVKELLSAVEQ